MATSGTVATTVFTTQQVVDHAFRRCKLTAQQITAEHIDIALDLLWLLLQTLNTRGIILNLLQNQYLGFNEGDASLQSQPGTLNVYFANLRSMTRIAGTGSSTSGTAANAFDGDLSTTCTELAPAGSITLAFTTTSALNMVGILPGTSGTWSFTIQTSPDNVTWTTQQSVSSQSVTAGMWLWYEIQSVPSASYARIVAGATTTLSVTELVFGNNVQDVPIAPIDRDTYDSLPNKSQTGRPVQYWYDRQRTLPQLMMYPPPSSAYVQTYCAVLRVQRQFMDVGTMVQEIEIPNRWYLPIIADLARNLAAEIKEVDPSLIPSLEGVATRLLAEAWNGESDGANAKLLPNLSVYQL